MECGVLFVRSFTSRRAVDVGTVSERVARIIGLRAPLVRFRRSNRQLRVSRSWKSRVVYCRTYLTNLVIVRIITVGSFEVVVDTYFSGFTLLDMDSIRAPANATSPMTTEILAFLKGGPLVLPAPGCSSPEPSTSSSPTGSDKTDNHDLFTRNTADMRREDERLKTFENWPVPFLSPELLARNGFYYLRRGDEVRCAFCKVEIMKWMVGDDPATDHRRWAPQCPFLRRQTASGNVPIEDGGRDECGVHVPQPAQTPARMPGPKYPHYASEDARLRTFSDWPRSMRQKPEELAEAGFFYTGQGDKTKCFYCNGGLKDWENDDVPWEQHARWFSRCAYVQLVKGREYIQKVIAQAEGETQKPETETKVETNAKDTPKSEDDSKLCKICYNEELNICFVPCGHVVACAKCALTTDKCPMCRRTFTNAVRLYFS